MRNDNNHVEHSHLIFVEYNYISDNLFGSLKCVVNICLLSWPQAQQQFNVA